MKWGGEGLRSAKSVDLFDGVVDYFLSLLFEEVVAKIGQVPSEGGNGNCVLVTAGVY